MKNGIMISSVIALAFYFPRGLGGDILNLNEMG